MFLHFTLGYQYAFFYSMRCIVSSIEADSKMITQEYTKILEMPNHFKIYKHVAYGFC